MRGLAVRTLRITLLLAAGVLLLILAFRGVRLEDLLSYLKSAKFEWVALSLVPAFFALISRTFRWILLIRPLGYRPKAANTFYALMTGYLVNFLLPRAGEITRCGYLNRTDRIPADSLFGTVITERIIDVVTLMVITLAVFFMKIDFFGKFLINSIITPALNRFSALVIFPWYVYLVLALAVIAVFTFFMFTPGRLAKYNLNRRLRKIAGRIFLGMRTILGMKDKLQFLLHTFLIWLMYFLMTWALFMALPSTSSLGAPDVLFIMVVGGLGMAVPVQGGIGSYHLVVSVGLGLFGISREEGLAFATLSHESQALLLILGGLFSMFMLFGRIKKKDRTADFHNNPNKI